MIAGFDRPKFETTLRETLSPSEPIRSAELLRGRQQNLEEVRQAFVQNGRQVFIYGDRGVGKTSLAQTAAYEHASASDAPIFLSCRATFFSIVNDLISRLAGRSPFLVKESKSTKGKAGPSFFGGEYGSSSDFGRFNDLQSLNEIINGLRELCPKNRERRICVFDEFELIEDEEERKLFGDFIKQLSDQEINLRVIFCGIGESIARLLGDHPSAPRYLQAVELKTLNIPSRLEIIEGVESAFDVEIEYNSKIRISQISDGFPHYVHLICEKMFWSIFEDQKKITVSSISHYKQAIESSVRSINPFLKSMYDKATKKYNSDYAHVLWAAAGHPLLERRSADIFKYYEGLPIPNRTALDRARFNQRLNALKKPAHGEVLIGTRQGWYRFRESMLRGYVRLKAEEAGVELAIDHPLASVN
jgi:hypothetical protein